MRDDARMGIRKVCPSLVALALMARIAAAQYGGHMWTNPYSGTTWNNPMSSLVDTMIHNQINNQILNMTVDRANGGAAAEPAQPEHHEPFTKTDFRPSKSRLVVDQIINGLAQNDEQRRGLTTGINAVFTEFEKAARKNNVAYALTFMIAASLGAQTGTPLSDPQTEALAIAINDALAASPAFTSSSAADRQKLYEGCITIGGLVVLFQQVGLRDPASAAAARALAQQALAMVGINTGNAPAAPAPAPAAARPGPATCMDTLTCYSQCAPLTPGCVVACEQRTTTPAAQASRAVLDCMSASGCADQTCIVQRCGTQLTTCTNVAIAAAPAPAPVRAPDGPDDFRVDNAGVYLAENRVIADGVNVSLAGQWQQDLKSITLRLRDDGTYALRTGAGVAYVNSNTGAFCHAVAGNGIETGTWVFANGTLTLTPKASKSTGVNGYGPATNYTPPAPNPPRAYTVSGVTIEYTPIDAKANPMRGVTRTRPGLHIRGKAQPGMGEDWDYILRSAPITLDK